MVYMELVFQQPYKNNALILDVILNHLFRRRLTKESEEDYWAGILGTPSSITEAREHTRRPLRFWREFG